MNEMIDKKTNEKTNEKTDDKRIDTYKIEETYKSEIFELVEKIAKEDDRIRGVYLNGFRANKNVENDEFQDYDLVFIVTDVYSYVKDESFIRKFGNILIKQEPDSPEFGWNVENLYESYPILVLYDNFIRIDFHFESLDYKGYLNDTLTKVLIDKDNLMVDVKDSSDIMYFINKPSQEEFNGCTNEFFWCLNNVCKGLLRGETPYVMKMYNVIVHDMIFKMTSWYISKDYDFKINVGLYGKNFNKLLNKEMYDKYISTFCDSKAKNIWDTIYKAVEYFKEIAVSTANKLNFNYRKEDEKIILYIKYMHNLHLGRNKE